MGKKSRRDREEKRESYAIKRNRQNKKNVMIAAGILAVVAAIVAFSAYKFATESSDIPGAPPGAGPLGGEHVHASVLVKIFGDTFDFSQSPYQIQSSWIHFEGQDGTTVHRHASGVTLGYLFNSMDIGLDDQCYIFPNEREFCTNDEYSLKFYINGEKVPDIREHVILDQDRILISYGAETEEEIEDQLRDLNTQIILG